MPSNTIHDLIRGDEDSETPRPAPSKAARSPPRQRIHSATNLKLLHNTYRRKHSDFKSQPVSGIATPIHTTHTPLTMQQLQLLQLQLIRCQQLHAAGVDTVRFSTSTPSPPPSPREHKDKSPEIERQQSLTHLSLLQEAADRAQMGVVLRDLELFEM